MSEVPSERPPVTEDMRLKPDFMGDTANDTDESFEAEDSKESPEGVV